MTYVDHDQPNGEQKREYARRDGTSVDAEMV